MTTNSTWLVRVPGRAGYFVGEEAETGDGGDEAEGEEGAAAVGGNGGRGAKAASRKDAIRALSIRQPHAEAIMRGVKQIEYRTRPTKVRGRIYVYATLGRYAADEEGEMMAMYGIEDVSCDDLPRGVIVGTAELYDCDGGDWHVRNPERAKKLRKPTNHPQPVWFNPF